MATISDFAAADPVVADSIAAEFTELDAARLYGRKACGSCADAYRGSKVGESQC